ncbi:unnamed protein product, partial [Vitis vinifera]
MAKGRKLTTSRSERLLGSFAYGHGQGAGADSSELGEEDVWSMVDDMVERDDHVGGLSLAFDDSGKTASSRIVHHRKMAATSVLEGVGRTLKGRDMSRVRDAVWSQTGFDG